MIAPLRRRHYRIWIALAILLPAATLSALLARPEWPSEWPSALVAGEGP